MRLRNYIGIIGFVLIIIIISGTHLYIPPGLVPIAFWEYPVFIIVALAGTFFLNTFIEYGVLYDISRSHDVDKRKLLISVILVQKFERTKVYYHKIDHFIGRIKYYIVSK